MADNYRMNAAFLIVGLSTESITSKISTSGGEYIHKRLESKPENWATIIRHLESRELSGAVVTLTDRNYAQIASDKYKTVAEDFLKKLAAVPHIVLVHEAVFGGAPLTAVRNATSQKDEEWDGFTWNDHAAREHFGDIDEGLRKHVNMLLESIGIVPVVYKRNIEFSVLAASFIDDQQNNLLFRLYLPAGQLFDEESAQLLTLFHDWLLSVRGKNIRQGGYQTANGRVVEFFADSKASSKDWPSEIQQFNYFLSLVDQPDAAQAMLEGLGVSQGTATDLVSRYSRRLRRLQLDVKHERERRVLLIQQELEAELLDHGSGLTLGSIGLVVDRLVPTGPRPAPLAESGTALGRQEPPIQINQQIFHHVEGVVAQRINGNFHRGQSPTELIDLITRLGGHQANELITAAHELADSGAPTSTRLGAKQKLKAFILKATDSASAATIGIMQKWVEQQMGLGS